MTNQFCRALSHKIFFTNLSTSNLVNYKPCCFFTKDITVSNKEQFNNARKIISSINNWTPLCQKCKNFEIAGVKSPRIDSNEDDLEGDEDSIELEIQMDKTCNAACITCGEWSSTTWSKYNNKINNISTQFIIKPDTEPNVKKILDLIDFEKTSLRSILFLGGEPFANDSHLDILKNVPSNKTSNIRLSYTTNGSYDISDKCLEVFSKFKEVDISYSLDGIGEVFNYHRWPLNWDTVENNFKKILSYDTSKRISVSIGCTLTALNVFYFDQLEQWVDKLSKEFNKPIVLDVNPAYGVMTLASMPIEYVNTLKIKYANNENLLGCIASSQPHTEYAKKELLKHIEYHDLHRKISWKETFPDIVKYFN
jgi:organic radical activating enzyme